MVDTNPAWYPAAGGVVVPVGTEPDRSHHADPTENRRSSTPTSQRSRTAPTVEQPRTEPLDVSESSVYTPNREVLIDGTVINADTEIKIRADAVGVETADISLFNLDVATWKSISKRETVEVRLGWRQSTAPTVFRGRVVTKRPRKRGADSEYMVRAIGLGGFELKRSDYSRTFNGISPHRIVSLMTHDLGIERGYISTLSLPIDGYYAITRMKTVKKWLDNLAKLAANQTGMYWVWYIDNGKLSFHPTTERATQVIELSTEKSLERATPVGNPQSGDDHPYELFMHCEPAVQRGLAVTFDGVADVTAGRNYRIKSYVFDSSSITRRHRTYATATPLADRSEVYTNARG